MLSVQSGRRDYDTVPNLLLLPPTLVCKTSGKIVGKSQLVRYQQEEPFYGPVAQTAERLTCNEKVEGATPSCVHHLCSRNLTVKCLSSKEELRVQFSLAAPFIGPTVG